MCVRVMRAFSAGVRTEPRWRRGSRARPAGGRTDGMVVECLWRVHAYTQTHTHTCGRSDDTQTQTHTSWLAGTILASERRSQSHRRSFQEGRPQSHCTGFPTGEGWPGESGEEGGRRGRRKSVCVFVCLRIRVYMEQGLNVGKWRRK